MESNYYIILLSENKIMESNYYIKYLRMNLYIFKFNLIL